MNARSLGLATALMAQVALSGAAYGVPITFSFTGTITSVDPVLAPTINTTQTVSGWYTFESTTPAGSSGDPDRAPYPAITDLSLSIDGLGPWTYGTTFKEIRIDNNDGANLVDRYLLGNRILSGPSVNGYVPFNFNISLIDNQGTVFSSLALPLTPPPLSEFELKTWSLEFVPVGANTPKYAVTGTLTELTQKVPEPATLALVGLGLAGLGFGRRRAH